MQYFRYLVLVLMILGSAYLFVSRDVTHISTTRYSVVESGGRTSIYLSSVIGAPVEYLSLIQHINKHKDVKEMDVYIVGRGGQVNALVQLINTMNMSPTKFHGIVIGNVSSAHAVLAMNMDSLTVANDDVLFLFHRPAVGRDLLPASCLNIPKSDRDRGISARNKCVRYITKYEQSLNNTAMGKTFPAMNEDQLDRYYRGDDVTVAYGEIKTNLEASK